MSNKAIKDESVFETRRFTSAFFFSMQVAISLFLISFFPNGKGKIGGWVGGKQGPKEELGGALQGKRRAFSKFICLCCRLTLLSSSTSTVNNGSRSLTYSTEPGCPACTAGSSPTPTCTSPPTPGSPPGTSSTPPAAVHRRCFPASPPAPAAVPPQAALGPGCYCRRGSC